MILGLCTLVNLLCNNFTLFLLSIVLLPQIFHNMLSTQLCLIDYTFFITSFCIKLLNIIYFRICPYNILEIAPVISGSASVIVINIVFIFIIIYQRRLGSTFLIPKVLLPKKYEYLRKLSPENEELKTEDELEEECIICMDGLSKPVPKKWEEFEDKPIFNSFLKKSKDHIMITPCNHKFHIPCLLNWMAIKMECPTCRGALPTLF